MMTSIDRLRSHWSQEGIRIRPGVSLQQIEAFERRYQVRLPPDLRQYFTKVDGMEAGETDHDMFSFLPLEAVKSLPEELAHFGGIPDFTEIMWSLPDPHCWFVIVDYLITSAVYAIRLAAVPESTPVLWIGSGKHHRVVAPSFSGFADKYLANPFDLL